MVEIWFTPWVCFDECWKDALNQISKEQFEMVPGSRGFDELLQKIWVRKHRFSIKIDNEWAMVQEYHIWEASFDKRIIFMA
jgi:hypothetical protein